MSRSIRCPHAIDRELIPCQACGDYDKGEARELKMNARRPARKPVVSKPHGTTSRRERLMYATRERQAGR